MSVFVQLMKPRSANAASSPSSPCPGSIGFDRSRDGKDAGTDPLDTLQTGSKRTSRRQIQTDMEAIDGKDRLSLAQLSVR